MNLPEFKTKSHIIASVLLFFTVYLLNLYSPLRLDDYLKSFIISTDPPAFTDEPISSLTELFSSIWNHRYVLDGRLADALLAVILYFVGKSGFNFLNSGIILLSIWCVCKFCFPGKFSIKTLLPCLLTVLITIPCIRGTIFWCAGAFNYLWTVPFLCFFLILLRKLFEQHRLAPPQLIGLSVCGFIGAGMHEASGVILIGTICFYSCFRRTDLLFILKPYLLVLSAVLLGTMIPLTAPGIWGRAGSLSALFTAQHIIDSSLNFNQHCRLSVPILFFFLWKYRCKSLNSLNGCYLISSFLGTLLFGRYGSWGGGFFYLGFGLLIFMLPEFVRLFNDYPKLLYPLSVLLFLGASTRQFIEFYHIDQLIKTENLLAQTQSHFSIPLHYQDYDPWYSVFSTPGSGVSATQYSIINKVPPHRFVFQTLPVSNKAFNLFKQSDPHHIQVRRFNNLCLIRLPQGMMPNERGKIIIPNQGKNAGLAKCELSRNPKKLAKIVAYFNPNRDVSLYSTDYDDGFFYLILPEPAAHYHELVWSVVLSDGKIQDLLIDLDQDPFWNQKNTREDLPSSTK